MRFSAPNLIRSNFFPWWFVTLVVLCPAFASAQSPAAIIKEFGLFGTWADDCTAEAGPKNAYAIFSVTSRGHVELRNDFGPNYDDMIYRIVAAWPISHFRLSLRQLLVTDDQIALNAVMMKANDKIRVWSLHGTDGSAFVTDGEIPATNGQATGWMERCNVKWTSRVNQDGIRSLRHRASPGLLSLK
jgi:hypothetical protein